MTCRLLGPAERCVERGSVSFYSLLLGTAPTQVGSRYGTAVNGPVLSVVLNAERKRSIGRSQRSRPWVCLPSAPLDLSLCSVKSLVTQSRGCSAEFGPHCFHSGFSSRPAVVIYFKQSKSEIFKTSLYHSWCIFFFFCSVSGEL